MNVSGILWRCGHLLFYKSSSEMSVWLWQTWWSSFNPPSSFPEAPALPRYSLHPTEKAPWSLCQRHRGDTSLLNWGDALKWFKPRTCVRMFTSETVSLNEAEIWNEGKKDDIKVSLKINDWHMDFVLFICATAAQFVTLGFTDTNLSDLFQLTCIFISYFEGFRTLPPFVAWIGLIRDSLSCPYLCLSYPVHSFAWFYLQVLE